MVKDNFKEQTTEIKQVLYIYFYVVTDRDNWLLDMKHMKVGSTYNREVIDTYTK